MTGAPSASEPDSRLLALAQELRAIGEMGAVLTDGAEDRERYRRVLGIAEVLATTEGRGPVRPPADVAEQWFHVSPLMSADCAAFEVGERPADAAVREAYEEVGLRADAVALIGQYDSRSTGTDTPFHVVHLVYACRVTDAYAMPSTGTRES